MESFFAVLLTLILSLMTTSDVDHDMSFAAVVSTSTAQVVRVIDGDTIDVRMTQSGEVARIRYIGIDTPEPYRDGVPACFSAEATMANKNLVDGKTVMLVSDQEDSDQYDRLLRYVYVGDDMINEELLAGGYATVLPIEPNTKYAQSFKALADTARVAEVGLWGTCVQ